MFTTPIRLLNSLRLDVPFGVVAATAVSTIVFASTPFLIPALATEYDVGVGAVGIMSTLQLLGFVLASSVGPRVMRPRRRVMVIAVALGIAANLASAFAPSFSLLLISRAFSGVSLGLIAWLSWAEVFGQDERVADVAVIGPLIGTVASPIVAIVLDYNPPRAWFLVLMVLYFVPAASIQSMRFSTSLSEPHKRHRPTRAAFAILVGLGLLTCGGSSVFIFAAAIGEDAVGLSAGTISIAYALNSLASVPSAKWPGPRGRAGFWMGLTALCALTLGTITTAAGFFAALIVWGFAFWMGIPGAFSILAERSAYPAERAGDAQAVMAAGRVFGPLIGGAAYAVGTVELSIVAGTIMLAGAGILALVEWRVHPRQAR